jgi:F-type H+-transporting ATPase subunit delta
MPTSGVARRYARAVFEIANEENDLDGWLRDLQAIRDLLQDPTLAAFLSSPAVPAEAKMRMCENAMAHIGEKQRNFVYVLIQNKRIGLVPDVVVAYEEELDRRRGIVHARVTTAIPLNDHETASVSRRLEDVTGRKVVMTTSVDPAIVGGFVARIGDQLIDASVVGRLQALRASLMA